VTARRLGYAHDTAVPVDRSKQQIEGLLAKHGAEGFHTGWQAATSDDPGWDAVEFLWKTRTIRFKLARPKATGYRPNQTAIDQKNRQRWRVLHLVIKAKLEAVDAGVAIFEEEFLPFIVTGDGRTVAEHLVPRLVGGGQLLLGDGAR
jgi:hypothetical protein